MCIRDRYIYIYVVPIHRPILWKTGLRLTVRPGRRAQIKMVKMPAHVSYPFVIGLALQCFRALTRLVGMTGKASVCKKRAPLIPRGSALEHVDENNQLTQVETVMVMVEKRVGIMQTLPCSLSLQWWNGWTGNCDVLYSTRRCSQPSVARRRRSDDLPQSASATWPTLGWCGSSSCRLWAAPVSSCWRSPSPRCCAASAATSTPVVAVSISSSAARISRCHGDDIIAFPATAPVDIRLRRLVCHSPT